MRQPLFPGRLLVRRAETVEDSATVERQNNLKRKSRNQKGIWKGEKGTTSAEQKKYSAAVDKQNNMERNPSKNHQRNKKRDSRIKEQSKENKEKDKTIGGKKLKEIYQQYLKERIVE